MIKPETLPIISNKKISEDHYVIRFKSKKISKSAKPGQFVQVLLNDYAIDKAFSSGIKDPLLARPFSFLNIERDYFDLLYQVVGKGTAILSKKKKNEYLSVLGPLGNGWQTNLNQKDLNLVLVGGGVGIPPLYHFAKHNLKKIKSRTTVFLGGRNKSLLHCEKDFKKLGIKVFVSTDDGSKGHKGLITEVLDSHLCKAEETLDKTQILTCGPTPMLKAVSTLAKKFDLPTQVSVEEPMPCGFGVCLGCAIKVEDKDNENDFRYALSCTEGPVFCSEKVLWE